MPPRFGRPAHSFTPSLKQKKTFHRIVTDQLMCPYKNNQFLAVYFQWFLMVHRSTTLHDQLYHIKSPIYTLINIPTLNISIYYINILQYLWVYFLYYARKCFYCLKSKFHSSLIVYIFLNGIWIWSVLVQDRLAESSSVNFLSYLF